MSRTIPWAEENKGGQHEYTGAEPKNRLGVSGKVVCKRDWHLDPVWFCFLASTSHCDLLQQQNKLLGRVRRRRRKRHIPGFAGF